jgi:hypothetical protein
VASGRTTTQVTRLSDSGRHEELARMIGGARVSETARRNAREMFLLRQGESEGRAKGESERQAKGESESAGRGK